MKFKTRVCSYLSDSIIRYDKNIIFIYDCFKFAESSCVCMFKSQV